MSTDTHTDTEIVNVAKRNYLTEEEIDLLIAETKKSKRTGKRNALMILMAYRHGLRVSELVDITWDQVNFTSGHIMVFRRKNGTPSNQPLSGDELRSLRSLKRESKSRYVFVSERGDRMSTANVRMLFMELRKKVKLEVHAHAHALRHSCGYKLANQGVDTRAIQDYIGHVNVQNTVLYTQLSQNRFKGFDKLI